IGLKAPRGPSSLNPEFWKEHNVESLLGYCSLTRLCCRHQYLVCWRGGSVADNCPRDTPEYPKSLHGSILSPLILRNHVILFQKWIFSCNFT
ncbi:hypothetical protein VP01_4674g2, partial [Puccinia sorghi]